MPVIISSLFSALIIYITVSSMVKVLSIAYKREEITVLKYRLLAASFILTGIFAASVLPFGYQRIYEIML